MLDLMRDNSLFIEINLIYRNTNLSDIALNILGHACNGCLVYGLDISFFLLHITRYCYHSYAQTNRFRSRYYFSRPM